ncbi:MAG: thiamine-phosphate kinase [Vicinamibacterales bacterium]
MSSTSAAISVADLGERAIVERITRRLPRPSWVVVGPGDDAAVVESVPRTLEVLTTDALVEGVHFDRRFVPADCIGYRALAVNLSDLAAMGARPRAALLSLVLPATLDVLDLDQMIGGMVALADEQRIAIVGGNITRSTGPLIIDVTVTGSVKRRRVLTRAGARVGDEVYVTGTIGDATVGLASLRGTAGSAVRPTLAEARYLRPAPRGRVGVLLGEQKVATACIDLSDGLADGVRRIADASGVGITLDEEFFPFSHEVRDWFSGNETAMLDTGLRGGDDYELLFTCPPRSRRRLRGVQRLFGDLPITRIGMVTRDREVCLRTSAGKRPLPDGFAHFA